MKVVNLKGQVFGRLKVLKLTRVVRHNGTFWLCKCACGKKKEIRSHHLRRGKAKSCGCLSVELFIKRATSHGQTGTKAYRCWAGIKQRCLNPNNNNYFRYGAKGISVCKRWHKFDNFLRDMGNPPSEWHTIDRVENSKGYTKANCRWALPRQQSSNIKTNRHIAFEGRVLTLAQWARVKNIRYETLQGRLREGWPIKRALNEKTNTK